MELQAILGEIGLVICPLQQYPDNGESSHNNKNFKDKTNVNKDVKSVNSLRKRLTKAIFSKEENNTNSKKNKRNDEEHFKHPKKVARMPKLFQLIIWSVPKTTASLSWKTRKRHRRGQ
ncbi:hypothetical protein TNCT_236631 [Trichonephila clavata]|uniref:Uncharacterized protein n=1 Tax=Trichonephila clavata TaxID=2740835 RepID=A0A8X6J275_TRICU|nr:hypothetical protein TNCT_236631 [Trichonephila clavata]